MNIFVPPRMFDGEHPEKMDVANRDDAVLRGDLRNLRRINKYFGGLSPIRDSVRTTIEHMGSFRPVEILDLATGSADHPISLAILARSMDRPVRIVAVERNPFTASIARERTVGYPEISIETGDILSLLFDDRSFDIVLCSLALHHFSRPDGIRILRSMTKLSRVRLIVNELHRSWPAAMLTWLYTHLTTRNPMTLNDSFVSVLRGYRAEELRSMASEAGVPNVVLSSRPFFRLLLVGTHEESLREP